MTEPRKRRKRALGEAYAEAREEVIKAEADVKRAIARREKAVATVQRFEDEARVILGRLDATR